MPCRLTVCGALLLSAAAAVTHALPQNPRFAVTDNEIGPMVSSSPTPSSPSSPTEPQQPALPVTPSASATPAASTSANATEAGLVDSMLGDGMQQRIVGSVTGWITDKAKSNPGCIERFVCETYRTGENLSGLPYALVQVTNAAVSFMVAEMFDHSINMTEITRAARIGRTDGTCHFMECDFVDGQLRTVGDYLGSLEGFFSSVFGSIGESLNFG